MGNIPSDCKQGNIGPSSILVLLMVCPTFISIWVTVWCLESYRKVAAHTHVLYRPLCHCIHFSLSEIPNTRHQESNSDQDTAQGGGGGCIPSIQNRLESDHQNFKNPIIVRCPVIEQWGACHSRDQCTTTILCLVSISGEGWEKNTATKNAEWVCRRQFLLDNLTHGALSVLWKMRGWSLKSR